MNISMHKIAKYHVTNIYKSNFKIVFLIPNSRSYRTLDYDEQRFIKSQIRLRLNFLLWWIVLLMPYY